MQLLTKIRGNLSSYSNVSVSSILESQEALGADCVYCTKYTCLPSQEQFVR